MTTGTGQGPARKRVRRSRSDSVAFRKDLEQRLAVGVKSPIPLDDRQQRAFNSIIAEVPLTLWEDGRIRLAANTAKLMIYVEDLTEEMIQCGGLTENRYGELVMHPKQKALSQMLSSLARYSSLLGISATQTGASGRDSDQRRKAESEANQAIESALSSPLIP